ncbi:MAG: TonB-dependent receptor [Bacteroidetes bacterium]|nr:MAG: TonB-dependent receptor [Bacteroidota bacterium]
MKRILVAGILSFVLLSSSLFAQTIRVTGTVTDARDGSTLPGVSVLIKGTTMGSVTDFNGQYELSAPADATLVFSFVGYTSREIAVEGRTVINVALESALVGLEEVVVVGYGTQRREAVTGSVGIIGSQQIEQIPIASFDQILQGQTAGVSAIASSGRPGAGSTISIRGIGSISSGIQPLYVIDGVPISESRGLYENPLSGINPNDIESVTILKDASASAIYGSRAANGVILVTTKRGRAMERSQLTYRGQYGVANLTGASDFNMMNTQQKLEFERFNNIYTRDDEVWDSLATINTNWREEMFRQAVTQSHEISSSGGTERTRYFISGALFQQEGVLERSDFDRISGRLNLDHFVTEQLKFGSSINLSYEESNYSVAEGGYGNNVYNPIFAAYLMNPYEQPKDEDGEWITEFDTYFGNVVRELNLNQDFNNTLKFIGNIFAEYEPIDNLLLRSSLGTDFHDYTYEDYLHPEAVWGAGLGGSIRKGFRRAHTTTFTNTARYNRSFANIHNVTGLLGFETTQSEREVFSLRGDQFASDKVRVPNAASDNFQIGGTSTSFSVISLFTQINYAFDNRYFVDLSFRRDGSSRFGRENRYANFYSVGFNWNLKREAFLANVDFINNLRFRTSYGTTGNYAIGNFDHLGLYTLGLSYMQRPGSAPIRPANPNLVWERSEALNIAVETRFFDLFNFNVEVYNRVTKDMLLLMPVSRTSGFTSERRNVGQMTNRGIELTLDTDIVRTTDFSWSFNANFTYNRNTIDELYLDVTEYVSGNTIVQEGSAYGTFYYNRFAGVNPANGRPLWYDSYGNLTASHRDDDRVVLEGQTFVPPYFGGFGTVLNYRNFQLNALFSFVYDKWMVNNTKYFIANQSNFGTFNQSADVLDHWKEPGDNVHYPLYGTVPGSIFDTRFLEDASFLRLRNVVFAYRLPSELVQRMRLQSMRLYVQGQNLWTLTSYTGFDPEYLGSSELNSYPAVRTVTLGIDIGL